MENNRVIKIILTVVGALLVLPFFVYAYDDKTTHPALTQEIIKLFNSEFKDLNISNEDAGLIIQGSIDEDKGVRWLNHFYDPVYNRGLVLENDAFPKDQNLAVIASHAKLPFLSAKSWALSSRAQGGANFLTAGILSDRYDGESDYSWERAIFEYAWGDKQRGLLALGHVLHLLEDASVPDHTRNDPHPAQLHDASPYEKWSVKFNRSSADIANNLNSEKPILLSRIDEYFDGLANYSNNNFFSEDTIFAARYTQPRANNESMERTQDGLFKFIHGIDQSGRSYKLAVARRKLGEKDLIYSVKEESVLLDYWSLLSKQAVLHGAGVIKLFFDEVEKEKETKVLYEKNRSWIAKQLDKARGFAGILFGLNKTAEVSPPLGGETSSAAQAQTIEVSPPSGGETLRTTEAEPLPRAQPEVRPLTTIEVSPPTGGETSTPLPQPPSSDTSADVPIAGVSGPAPTPETPEVSPPTGEETSTTTLDTTPPNISLAITECSQSISADTCMVAFNSLNISWSSTSSDFAYFELECTIGGTSCDGFNISTTTATTTAYNLPQDLKIYTFKVKAVDTSGNQSTASAQTVEYISRPLIINEVAWAGTSSAQDQDEWIELYNPTDQTIDISQMKLKSSTDNKPNINLSGSIPAKSYYLIERTDDTTVSDLTASTTASFGNGSGSGLLNSGEALAIEYKGEILDQTPEISVCGGWCGGDAGPNYWTMERYDPLASGTSTANWGSWAGFLNNGLNADSAAIKGTPGRRNSINYLLTKDGIALTQNKTLATTSSPYIISNNFLVASGATLTINPGVVIKFLNASGAALKVEGVLKAEGTVDEPIVFTSIKDDAYGGDTNQDAASTTPAAGDWNSIKILANGSVIDQAIIRYGGVKDTPLTNHWANLRVENAEVTIKNSVIEYSSAYGIWLKNTYATIEGNTLRNHIADATSDSSGLVAENGTLTIQNNTFNTNSYGLRIISTGAAHSIAITSNTFTGNTQEAIEVISAYPTFSGNTISNSGTNGILYQGTISQNYSFSSNLSYKITTGMTVSASTTLTLDAGAILKFTNTGSLTVKGNLLADGTSANKVIFTSLNDDDNGGDTNNNGTTTVPAIGDWSQVHLENTTATSTITHAVFTYGTTALKLTGSSAVLDNILFKINTLGIQAVGTSTVEATNITFEGNTTDDDPASLIP